MATKVMVMPSFIVGTRGVAINLFRMGDKTGGLGTEVPQRGSRAEAKPPEAEDIYTNNHCNNVLTKESKTCNFFSTSEFPGRDM